MTSSRPLPRPRGEESAFFEAARDHALVYQRCNACGRPANHPRVLCPHCGSLDVGLERSAGAGTVYSFTIQHRPGGAGFAGDVPYTLVLVDLDEGFRAVADLVRAKKVGVGMRVRATFDDVTDEVTLPRFVPMSAEDDA